MGMLNGIWQYRMPLIVLCLLVLGIAFGLAPGDAFAQAAPPGTCTTDAPFQIPPYAPGTGLISTIVTNIDTVLTGIMQQMFDSIRGDSGFKFVLHALISLYIVIYGILFTFGMVQITLFDFIIRMVKVGIIMLLLSTGAWSFFSQTVVEFFNKGTNDMIAMVTAISVGGVSNPFDPSDPGSHPFVVLDDAVTKAVSAKMAVTLMATAFTGVYGMMYCLLLLMCLGSFVKALLTALWVYIMALVLKTLLFGLAPIFLSCLLFNRTKHLFDGWLNQVVNACLQPLFLFIFFAFFTNLILASIDQVLAVPVCWTEAAESVRGSPFHMHFWRFEVHDSGGNYEPYGGGYTFTGPQDAPYEGRIFPIDIMAILIFFLLAELANRFNSIIIMVAKELAATSTDLSTMRGALSDWFSPQRGAQGLLGNLGSQRPGGVPGITLPSSRGGESHVSETVRRMSQLPGNRNR
jgi:type IV secretory pathway VirB6-like protein